MGNVATTSPSTSAQKPALVPMSVYALTEAATPGRCFRANLAAT